MDPAWWKVDWLRRVHPTKLQQVHPELGYVIAAETYGNTLFYWMQMQLAHHWLRLVDDENPVRGGLATMLEDVGSLLANVGDCLAQGIQSFIARELQVEGDEPLERELDGPPIAGFFVPFFYTPA